MSPQHYGCMNASNISWECIQCGMPNFSTSLFNHSTIETSNLYDTLNDNSVLGSPGAPKATSSPIPKQYLYNIYRTDRPPSKNNQSYGGVLLAVTKEFISTEIQELKTDCEIIWAQINISGPKNLLVGSYYRPPSDDGNSIKQLDLSLSRINQTSNSNILVGGDFNLGHIDWSVPEVIPGKPDQEQHNSLLELLYDHNLHQIVNIPTRKERILDLVLINNPSNINKVSTLPPIGLSDHDIVYVEPDIWLRRVREKPRKILKYNKANWDNIKLDLEKTYNDLQNLQDKTNVNDMWNTLKTNLTQSVENNIPHKFLTYKNRLPWIHNNLRKMINRKNKLYYKMKQNTKYADKYKHLKKQVQKEQRTQTVVLDGESSDLAPVTSGVPQGTVLGPVLFLVYINDLPEYLQSSKLRLFADDSIIYKTIKSQSDCDALQLDLDAAARWKQDWLMAFHPDKCTVLTVSQKKNPFKHDYIHHNHKLELVSSAKYLGITLQANLKWSKHTDNIIAIGNKSLGLLKRNLKTSCQNIKTQAYLALVRPKLEYSCSVWDPHTVEQTSKIEMVQRRAARYVCNRYHNISTPTDMINTLNWPTLQERRTRTRLIMFYKIVHQIVAIPSDSRTRKNHNYTFRPHFNQKRYI
ncbi:uncharacterized protein [Mytilus edulis]|uniref:uncharacterized protein n=1 Tax=Mytilus edulis TaxID=6550 RepID=UPI0039EE70C4